jgi:hypothetical protein
MTTDQFTAAFSQAFDASSSTGWVTIDEARDWWRDAAGIDDAYLQMILDMAEQQVLEFGSERIADEIAVSGVVPNNYRLAQLTQTRNIWNKVKQDPGYQGIGDEPFAFIPVDLTQAVQKMIRPRRAKPVVA